jgi:hypothetical protein
MNSERSTLVAVFHDRAMAEQAIERLQEAGIQNDRLFYSGGSSGSGALAVIKNLYAGENYPQASDLASDLEYMGLVGEKAAYYVREHQAGHPIVVIDAGEHVREAVEIVQQNGVYRYDLHSRTNSTAIRQAEETSADRALQDIQGGEEEYDDNASGEGEHTSGYWQTDNVLRGVESTQPPMHGGSDAMRRGPE